MRKHTLIKRAAVVACSAALVANPAVALAAGGASNQPIAQTASQVGATHSLELHGYDAGYTYGNAFAALKTWWPTGLSSAGGQVPFNYYRLTSGSAQYNVGQNNDKFTLPSGTYAVEGGIEQGILNVRWNDLGTLALNRYWELDVLVEDAPEGMGGIKVGSTTVADEGTVKVSEGVATTVTPVAVPNYDVSVTLDDEPVALNANGSFILPARSGQDGMGDSQVTVTYSKRPVRLGFNVFGAVSYNPNKDELLGEILDKICEGNAKLYDDETDQEIAGLTKDDLAVSYDGDLNAGKHEVTLTYKGTIGGVESVYSSGSSLLTVMIDPATVTLSWGKELGEATGSYQGKVDGVISYGDAQTFDFAAADSGVPGATFKTLFYRGVGNDAALLGEDVPSEPGLYTEVVTMTEPSGNYFASPLTRTFAIGEKPATDPATPSGPKTDPIGPTGGATAPSDKPAAKKAAKKDKAALPKTGDASVAPVVVAGVAGAAVLAAAALVEKSRRNN